MNITLGATPIVETQYVRTPVVQQGEITGDIQSWIDAVGPGIAEIESFIYQKDEPSVKSAIKALEEFKIQMRQEFPGDLSHPAFTLGINRIDNVIRKLKIESKLLAAQKEGAGMGIGTMLALGGAAVGAWMLFKG